MKTVKKVYGPYTRKDNRQHVIVIFTDNSRRTVSYPKYLMEQRLGRELHPDNETIDHIDGDFTNNDLSNLRIVPRSKHISEDQKKVRPVAFFCVWCGKLAARHAKDLHHNSRLGKVGPFCGR